MSQAKVDEWLHSDRGSPWEHHDTGGDTGSADPTSSTIGGLTPSSSTMNPLMQNLVQRYGSLSNEQLQELIARIGTSSTYGQVASKILSQRRIQPNAGGQQQGQQSQQQVQTFQPQQLSNAFQQSSSMQPPQQQSSQQQPQGFAYGGDPMGVSMSMASPWWTRSEARSADSGLLNGQSLGRADSVKTTAPSGSYVMPADVISGLGEGSTLAGARVMQEIVSSGPHGTPLPRMTHGRGPPTPLHVAAPAEAKGGGVQESASERTPVALSDGEFVVSPQQVAMLGGGDVKRGHRILDALVVKLRKRHIKKLSSLPGPVKE